MVTRHLDIVLYSFKSIALVQTFEFFNCTRDCVDTVSDIRQIQYNYQFTSFVFISMSKCGSISESYLQGLVGVGHWQDFVSCVDAAQFAERAEQPLTGPTVELQLLLVMLRAGQNLRNQRFTYSSTAQFTYKGKVGSIWGCVLFKEHHVAKWADSRRSETNIVKKIIYLDIVFCLHVCIFEFLFYGITWPKSDWTNIRHLVKKNTIFVIFQVYKKYVNQFLIMHLLHMHLFFKF